MSKPTVEQPLAPCPICISSGGQAKWHGYHPEKRMRQAQSSTDSTKTYPTVEQLSEPCKTCKGTGKWCPGTVHICDHKRCPICNGTGKSQDWGYHIDKGPGSTHYKGDDCEVQPSEQCFRCGCNPCTCGEDEASEAGSDSYRHETLEADEPTKSDVQVHLTHCYQGDWSDSCKYGGSGCPAEPTSILEGDERLTNPDLVPKECPKCNGTGLFNPPYTAPCFDCDGSGKVVVFQPDSVEKHRHNDGCKLVMVIRNTTIDEGVKLMEAHERRLVTEALRSCQAANLNDVITIREMNQLIDSHITTLKTQEQDNV